MDVLVEFDYVAQNIDELDIQKGDRIRNVVQKEEGWFEGELAKNGKIGLFPDNFVKTVKVPPPALISKSLPYPPTSTQNKQNIMNNNIQKNVPTSSPPPPPPQSILTHLHQQQQQKNDIPILKPQNNSFKARVLYSYIPVNEDELGIQENETVEVLRLVEDGWFEGICEGKQGVFPSNYVEKMQINEPQIKVNKSNSNDSLNNIDNIDENGNKKNKKIILGIGLGNIFSGKTIELKTKENFTNQKSTISVDHNESLSERNNERQISDSINEKITTKITKVKGKVLYEYLPAQSDELHLNVGDMIYILDKNLDDEGWYRGESIKTGEIGVFPDNFVEEIDEPKLNTEKTASFLNNDTLNLNGNSQNGNSLTNSTMSNSSSNNSLTKILPVNKNSLITSTLKTEDQDNISKSQSELSEDLEAEFLNRQNSDINKLVHIKKGAKQMNKRPPSFRKKKGVEPKIEDEKIEEKIKIENNSGSENEKIKLVEEMESSKVIIDPAKEDISNINKDNGLPPIISPNPVSPLSKIPINGTLNRQNTNLSSVNGSGTVSELSMATVMTNIDPSSPSVHQGLFEEVNTLKEDLILMRKENKELHLDFSTLKSYHDDQTKKMNRKLSDLITEIDEEKKTRLSLQVELERMKRTIMNNL